MTTCAVKWCCAGAVESGDKCAVHSKIPNYEPGSEPSKKPDVDDCETCDGSGECQQCDGTGDHDCDCPQCTSFDCEACNATGECPDCE